MIQTRTNRYLRSLVGTTITTVVLFAVVLTSGCQESRTDSVVETVEQPSDVVDAPFSVLTPGEDAPRYSVVSLSGDTLGVSNTDEYTLLNLWATWCGPCREEFPDLEEIHRELGPAGLRVLAVDVDPDTPEAVLNFANEFDLTFKLAVDRDGRIQEVFSAVGLPSSFLIDSDGTLLARWSGVLPPGAKETIREHLNEL